MSAPGVGLFTRHMAPIDRWVQLGLAGGRVIKVDFLDEPPEGADEDHPLLDRIERYLEEQEAYSFDDVEIALTGPTEHRPVYDTVRAVPFGTEISVQDVLERTAQLRADDGGAETIHQALAQNPVPIIVPDHRVRDASPRYAASVRERLRAIESID